MSRPWIGVDLDGTLAHYTHWDGSIGPPVPAMVERVKAALANGMEVRVFTARAADSQFADGRMAFCALETGIGDWLEAAGLPRLRVTCVKDFACVEIWDDRCRRVVKNTGEFLDQKLLSALQDLLSVKVLEDVQTLRAGIALMPGSTEEDRVAATAALDVVEATMKEGLCL